MITGLRTSVLIPAAKKAPRGGTGEGGQSDADGGTDVHKSLAGILPHCLKGVGGAPTGRARGTDDGDRLVGAQRVRGGVFAGSPSSSTGSSRRPPPPTTASIRPAARAAAQSRTIMVSDVSGMIATLCEAAATPHSPPSPHFRNPHTHRPSPLRAAFPAGNRGDAAG
jgi:hypothetical protein